MKRGAKVVLVAVLTVALALAVAACGGDGESPDSGDVKSGGVFRIGTDSGIDSMNPFVGFNTDTHNAFQNIYSFLIQYDNELNYAPDIATDWADSDGGKTWSFTIRPGIKFTNGEEVTAQGIADTINWANKMQIGFVSEVFGHLENAEASGDQLILHYDIPNAIALSKLAKWPILPPGVWTTMKTAKEVQEFENTECIGSGPFKVVKYEKRQILVCETNPAYYGDKPLIDGWGLQTFQNPDAMLQALKTGEIDAVEAIPGSAFEELQSEPNLEVVSQPSTFLTDLIINANPNKTTHRELLDPQVREAISHLINKQAIADLVFGGNAQPANSIVPPAAGNAPGTDRSWHNPNLPDDAYDVAQANALLDEAGYTKGADGIRLADGKPMEYELIVPTDAYSGVLRVADMVKNSLAEAGIKLSVKPLDSTAAYNAIIDSSASPMTPENSYKTFDMCLWNWTIRVDPEAILITLQESQYGALGDTGYANPAYDALYVEQFSEMDIDKRVDIVWEMQEMLAKDRPYIYLTFANKLQAWNAKWEGIVQTPGGFFNEISNYNLLHVHQK